MSRHIQIAFLLVAGLTGCSNEKLIDGNDDLTHQPVPGKVMLAMTVRTAPLATSGGGSVADLGTDAEQAINTLYVFVYNIGSNPYCEAKKFTKSDMRTITDGYTFEMEVTPGSKRFYLVANPRFTFPDNLTSYTQAELQDRQTPELDDHADRNSDKSNGGLNDDQIMTALKKGEGVPMSMSVLGKITLGTSSSGSAVKGELTLDDGSDRFSLVRVVAKVRLICRVKNELAGNNLNLNTLEILQANSHTFLFPRYAVSNNTWQIDFPSMTEAALLTRTVGYIYGKQENNSDQEWLEFDRGTHYFYENYFGPTLEGDAREGLIDETKYSRIHIVMDDGRDKTFPLPYLKRNDYLTVRISMTASDIICEIKPWEKEEIYPDYTDPAN